ncbi:MAG: NADH:ubiquinone reductase (Na(+)-transporting) subunit F [Algisphaera sp.]
MTTTTTPRDIDYSLIGVTAQKAVEQGLADADWYTTPLTRAQMRHALERSDGPALRDTAIWFGLLALTGGIAAALWIAGSWWCVVPFVLYGVLYGSASDSRWHESSHSTPFKTEWMNLALYNISSFMVMREPTPWRWSHTRHHSDTLVVGRDPEIAIPRPPDLWAVAMSLVILRSGPATIKKVFIHAFANRLTAEEATYMPDEAKSTTFWTARIWVLIFAAVILTCILTGSILPALLVVLPSFYGAWLMPVFGMTQHTGLAENVLDHRLNCRTVKMNLVSRFLYWNMNYHVEHHMFPLVPYHKLPALHELTKHDHPKPYRSITAAFREIIPAMLKQIKDPWYHVKRTLPEPTAFSDPDSNYIATPDQADAQGWINVCPADTLQNEDVVRFDCGDTTFAVYKSADGNCYATDGICTHGNTHLATGLVRGNEIECPKHNGRFDVRDGSCQRAPVCQALKTYDVRIQGDTLQLDIQSAGGAGIADEKPQYTFKVIRNNNVATFIKELVLEPVDAADDTKNFQFTPGDYIQFEVPPYELKDLQSLDIDEPYAAAWQGMGFFNQYAKSEHLTRRNYSLATNPDTDKQLRFNIRFSPAPAGMDVGAGVGSAWAFNLKPGDTVTARGPFGDFRIKDTQAEMVYLGGGAGMAPLRSQLSHLFDTLKTGRKVSYWYGARSLQEMFYADYFEDLAKQFPNFSFHLALSEPQPEDHWTGPTGFIHDVCREEYLGNHPDPKAVEYYLCGPPPMIKAVKDMLHTMSVSDDQIAYDEFS